MPSAGIEHSRVEASLDLSPLLACGRGKGGCIILKREVLQRHCYSVETNAVRESLGELLTLFSPKSEGKDLPVFSARIDGKKRWYQVNDPDTWKVWERALPTAMQGVSKSIRRSNVDLGPIEGRGEETFRGAGAVAKFDPFDLEERLENVAQFFSFATTRVNQRFELRHSQEELKRYWVGRQSAVKENYAWAILTEDKEVIELALKKLRQFNKEAPAVGLRVNAKKLKQSIREQFRRGHLREIGVPNEKAFREPFRKLAEAFPEGAPEG